eukprot:3533737-Pyramimonas_sp.AAC.1
MVVHERLRLRPCVPQRLPEAAQSVLQVARREAPRCHRLALAQPPGSSRTNHESAHNPARPIRAERSRGARVPLRGRS